MYGATPRCPRCEKSVYAAEQVLGPGRKFYHKPCLSCNICRRRLDSYNLVEHDEEPYCKPCHVKNFGTRDLRHQNLPLAARPRSSSSASSSSPPSPPPQQRPLSPTRTLSVNITGTNALLRPTRTRALSPTTNAFPRPRPKSMSSSDSGSGSSGSPSRRSSLYGSEPIQEEPERASLSSVAQRLAEEPDLGKATVTSNESQPEVDYSKATITPLRSNTGRPGTGALPRTVPLPLDYSARLSRHKSAHSLDGPVKTHDTSSSTSSSSSFAPSSFAARGATMDAITLLEQEGIMNPLQASPTGARFPLSRSSTTRSAQGNEEQQTAGPLQPSPTGTRYGASLNRAATLGQQTTGSPRKWGGTTPLCPACSKNVYFAEQVKAVGKTYHKACLRCTECRTGLDSTRLRDHDGIPFCVRCYGKLYGPQGNGYALLGKAGA
ncbi:hypothetical protein BKA70DRAFT_537216 [Coprinopsis sp. MPI-PUGE-AT-0042]|nr:hypothetical protein BKA70DRAFT_537216 [Coprinopsis sp. MPI-PUGE-AT-0042]